MTLLLILGYALVGTVIIMAYITLVVAMVFSFGVSVLSYGVMYLIALIRQKRHPDWSYKKPELLINTQEIKDNAVVMGVLALAFFFFWLFFYVVIGGTGISAAASGIVVGVVGIIVFKDPEGTSF